ncbi:hypothetical protein AAFF39_03320 [Lactococcus garvieae]
MKFILTIRDQKLRISIIRRSDFGAETKEMLQDTYGSGMDEEAWDDYNRQNELEKIAATVKRSQKRLQGLCMANKFDLFFTLTFNPKIVDSRDYEAVKKR